MQLTQAAFRLETTVEAQLRLGDHPDLAALGSELLELLRPAIKQTMMQVVEMAAHEVNGQLAGQRVDIRIVDGDPELVVSSDDSTIPAPPPPEPGEGIDAEARITLRLPGYLKELIAEAADVAGDSVNSFVVDALRSRAYRTAGSTSVKKTIDL